MWRSLTAVEMQRAAQHQDHLPELTAADVGVLDGLLDLLNEGVEGVVALAEEAACAVSWGVQGKTRVG